MRRLRARNFLTLPQVESLLTIASDLADVLSILPASGNPFTAGPREHLDQLLGILAMLRVGEYRFTPLLLAKVHEILPRLANPMLQSPPEIACEMDIFDGFGNAGMAQPPSLGMEDLKTEGPGSSSTSSLPDVTSPFTSPPSILSPGLDFASEFAPMSDMVMQQQRPIMANGISPLSQVAPEQTIYSRRLLRQRNFRCICEHRPTSIRSSLPSSTRSTRSTRSIRSTRSTPSIHNTHSTHSIHSIHSIHNTRSIRSTCSRCRKCNTQTSSLHISNSLPWSLCKVWGRAWTMATDRCMPR